MKKRLELYPKPHWGLAANVVVATEPLAFILARCPV